MKGNKKMMIKRMTWHEYLDSCFPCENEIFRAYKKQKRKQQEEYETKRIQGIIEAEVPKILEKEIHNIFK